MPANIQKSCRCQFSLILCAENLADKKTPKNFCNKLPITVSIVGTPPCVSKFLSFRNFPKKGGGGGGRVHIFLIKRGEGGRGRVGEEVL